jgi:hypothetical protein
VRGGEELLHQAASKSASPGGEGQDGGWRARRGGMRHWRTRAADPSRRRRVERARQTRRFGCARAGAAVTGRLAEPRWGGVRQPRPWRGGVAEPRRGGVRQPWWWRCTKAGARAARQGGFPVGRARASSVRRRRTQAGGRVGGARTRSHAREAAGHASTPEAAGHTRGIFFFLIPRAGEFCPGGVRGANLLEGLSPPAKLIIRW